MHIDIASIQNPQIRLFYSLWWPQHQIVLEFYQRLAEQHYDHRLVDRPARQSDTPRQSLAHLLYVQLVYFESARSGRLEFKSLGTEHYAQMSKAELLAEQERIDQEMFAYLTAESLEDQCMVEVFWGGQMNMVDVLFFLRDHDILHIGWNLALMDQLDMPRFPALVQYWG